MKSIILSIALLLIILTGTIAQTSSLPGEIKIRRTKYGVPHIKASSLKGVAFGLAYCELEDYGEKVIIPLIKARGDLARFNGYESIESDFLNQQKYRRASDTYFLLDQDTRNLLDGFADGVNYYLNKFHDEFSQYSDLHFTGYDVAAASTNIATAASARRFLRILKEKKELEDSVKIPVEAGSNAWAFAPERTKSGKTILLRNPHLSWSAGYYEAHLRVEGKLNFYGDFRIGGLFAIIGGFNDRLGWSTTNNHPDLNEIYSFKIDPDKPDHYILDGVSLPLQRKLLTAEFKNGPGLSLETREFLSTPFGPVIFRGNGKIYILKMAGDGEFRRGQQFTKMMMAKNLEEWKSAMHMQAITSSNYTYADADGNIFYVWNAVTPNLPVASGGDTSDVEVSSSSQIWKEPVPFDQLPQLLNPKGGYLHNENDPFHFTNLHEILPPKNYPHNFPEPRLRQRSQLSLQLIDNNEKFSLEEVVKLKHSMNMLLADQLKNDLLEIIRKSNPGEETIRAIQFLNKWDNTVAAKSRGGVLFEAWVHEYYKYLKGKDPFSIKWDYNKPMNTPRGISNESLAVSAFDSALSITRKKYGSWDIPWGDVHRVQIGDLDFPVGGGSGGLGCFRVIWFEEIADGKQKAVGGDGWQLVVEFSDPPKAYSVMAYGQSSMKESPHHTDQAEMFAGNKMKRIAFTEKEIKKQLILEYSPSELKQNYWKLKKNQD